MKESGKSVSLMIGLLLDLIKKTWTSLQCSGSQKFFPVLFLKDESPAHFAQYL